MQTISYPKRLFIVDDHPLVRTGLRGLIEQESGLIIAGEADSGEEALMQIPDDPPDLVLVDISMPGMDGIELTRHLRCHFSGIRVLIISTHHFRSYVQQAFEAGARGYLLKDRADDLIGEAVRTVLAGKQYLSPKVRNIIDS